MDTLHIVTKHESVWGLTMEFDPHSLCESVPPENGLIQITEEENGLKLTFSIMPARART